MSDSIMQSPSVKVFSPIPNYSETCVNGHLYSETTCIKRPLHEVPKVSAQYILTCIQRPPLYKGHYEVALAWPFNTGFTVIGILASTLQS